MSKPIKPLLVYFHYNGAAILYNLTREQYEKICDSEDDPSDTLAKFEIEFKDWDIGYAPGYLVELGKIFGFEVDSI
jgi:hypothetical protein